MTTGRLSEAPSGATPKKLVVKLWYGHTLESTLMKNRIEIIFTINVL